ncbi:MAG: EAL domain-containing protein, partial [Verrucomicrobiaceae bacterium]
AGLFMETHPCPEKALSDGRGTETFSVAYLDLDRFKLINHLYGHAAGDEILRQVSARVSNMLTGNMQLGRMGGDEFLLTMPETRIAHATLLCQGIVNSIGGRPYKVGDHAFHVRGSIGLIEVARGSSPKDAISTADRACREAKASHGTHLVIYERNSRIFQAHEEEMRLVGQLSATTDAPKGLYLEMQPIMSLDKPLESLNFEVLLRMRDPDGKPVPTPSLIAAGEFAGRMGVIDRWVLSNTLSWLSAHQAELGQTRFVCVNLSGASLNDERFVQEVCALLEQHRDIAHCLCLEITESIALHDLENTRRFIDRVRGFGAKVALDDFGAGYTSFSYLKDLPADLLKIDGSFIVNINQHPANIAIVEAIVNLARNLGMKTIAEWAEDFATVQTLLDSGVDYVQGYAIARSMPSEQILKAHSSADFVPAETMQAYIRRLEFDAAQAISVPTARLH